MPPAIAKYSSDYFYKGLLKSENNDPKDIIPIRFFDTAGADFNETYDENSSSLTNIKELEFIEKMLSTWNIELDKTIFISPYSAQVQQVKTRFPQLKKASTIDSFQGQEAENVIISLVRSNGDGKIGFLKDYRRMNVALTRAKKQVFIIGDSATVGNDEFYGGLIGYIEEIGGYNSVFEYLYE
jgi:superfamily I DNA and/or RNA helicase